MNIGNRAGYYLCKNSVHRFLKLILVLTGSLVCSWSSSVTVDSTDLPVLPGYDVMGQWLEYNLSPPHPVVYNAPRMPKRMIGTKVRMLFNINQDGTVSGISGDTTYYDYNELWLTSRMRAKLRTWQFEPARNKDTGKPVRVRVALPVVFVDHDDRKTDGYTCIGMRQPILLAVLDD